MSLEQNKVLNISLAEIWHYLLHLQAVEGEMPVNTEITITSFSPISNTSSNSLTWMRSQSLDWESIKASVIICEKEASVPYDNPKFVFIPVTNPRLVFAQIVSNFINLIKREGIESTARIGNNVSIGYGVYIGHYVVIGNNVKIGDNTVIHANVSIYDDVVIGAHCIVNSGVVIGADGYSYEKDESGNLIKIPHIGGVIIEDCVEIGANTCIDRGTLNNTIIKYNTKIDNLCHIAHNVTVGENVTVIASSVICGSTEIGDQSWIAPGAIIRDQLKIGQNCMVGLGSVVINDFENNAVVVGVPARNLRLKDKT